MNDRGRIVSLNVGRIATYSDGRRAFASAIGKHPIAEPAPLYDDRIGGDAQADLHAHGGPNRALYAYASEDYAWWETQLARSLPFGIFGENLTLAGIDVNGAVVGERWRVGGAIVRVTSPRIPCFKLAHVLGDPAFVKRFAEAHRPGAYLAIERAVPIGARDDVEVLSRPERRLTLREFNRIYFEDRTRAVELLEVPDMTDEWRAWAAREASGG